MKYDGVHSCGYHCSLPACVLAQRNELRDMLFSHLSAAFPSRRAVEREIERTENPSGMQLNDGKERVSLPAGTLRYMLALIDRSALDAEQK